MRKKEEEEKVFLKKRNPEGRAGHLGDEVKGFFLLSIPSGTEETSLSAANKLVNNSFLFSDPLKRGTCVRTLRGPFFSLARCDTRPFVFILATGGQRGEGRG